MRLGAGDEQRDRRQEAGKTVKVPQIGSPIAPGCTPSARRWWACELNKIGRVAELVDTPPTRGMIAKVAHLVRVVE